MQRLMGMSTEPRRARDIQATPEDADRPEWPPRAGTKVALYLPEAPDPEHEYLVAVDDLQSSVLSVTAPAGVDTQFERSLPTVKILFPGRRWSWGYDANLLAIERVPTGLWRLEITRGPVPVERRDSERVPHRTIVLLKHEGKSMPAHMLDRSDHGMRCITGRGADINVGDTLVAEVDAEAGDIVRRARVVWRRLAASGLEFGLEF
jgi:hypothetical protein